MHVLRMAHLVVEKRNRLIIQQRIDRLAGGLIVQYIDLLPHICGCLRMCNNAS
jgi:hypothetical protein